VASDDIEPLFSLSVFEWSFFLFDVKSRKLPDFQKNEPLFEFFPILGNSTLFALNLFEWISPFWNWNKLKVIPRYGSYLFEWFRIISASYNSYGTRGTSRTNCTKCELPFLSKPPSKKLIIIWTLKFRSLPLFKNHQEVSKSARYRILKSPPALSTTCVSSSINQVPCYSSK